MRAIAQLLAVLAAAVCLQAQIIILPDTTYPNLQVSPAAPVAGDDVELWVIEGEHSNTCTPTYTDLSVRIEQSPLAIYPPQMTVYVSYTEVPPSGTGGCGQAFTEYGPRYTLSDVPVGSYTVIDEKLDSVAGYFSVAQAWTVSGVVTDDACITDRVEMPLEGVRVTITTNSPVWYLDASGPIMPPYFYYYDTTSTSADGRFTLPDVPEGFYRMTFSLDGFTTQTMDISVYQDCSLMIKMLPEDEMGVVQGSVHLVVPGPTPTSPVSIEPCVECTVTAVLSCDDLIVVPMYKEQAPIMCALTYAVTDRDGAFAFDSIALPRDGEPVTVTASHSGYTPATFDTVMHCMLPTNLTFVLMPTTLAVSDVSARATRPSVLSYQPASNALRLDMVSSSTATISVHSLDGRTVWETKAPVRLSSGHNYVSLPSHIPAGSFVAKVRGDNTNAALRFTNQAGTR